MGSVGRTPGDQQKITITRAGKTILTATGPPGKTYQVALPK